MQDDEKLNAALSIVNQDQDQLKSIASSKIKNDLNGQLRNQYATYNTIFNSDSQQATSNNTIAFS